MVKNQLALEFPQDVDFSMENFMESKGNSLALHGITQLEGQGDVLVIYGEEGVGKSHLAAIWQNLTNARDVRTITSFVGVTHIYADDLETFTAEEQEQLFHAFNHIKHVNGALLVTSHTPPAQMDLLPDLKSRLLTGQQIEIMPFNEHELSVLFAKWAFERQLELPQEVIQYLLKRCERSPKVMENMLAKLDLLSLEQKRKITVPLAREALEEA